MHVERLRRSGFARLAASCAAVATALVASPPPAAARPPFAADGSRPGLVVASTLGLGLGTSVVPSGELSLFLGGSLPAFSLRLGTWVALGYQGSLSVGGAGTALQGVGFGLVTHRHLLAAHGMTGREGRLFFSAGAGPALSGRVVGVEAEGRLGYVFTQSARHRIRGILGGELRMTKMLGGNAVPQVGIFLGFTRAPTPAPAPIPGAPPRGVGLSTVGALLGPAAIFLLVSSAVQASDARQAGQADAGELWYYTGPAIGTMALGSIVMLAIGAIRRDRYRRWRDAREAASRAAHGSLAAP